MVTADPIPTVREDQAEGVVAAIFEDLRTTLRIPIVNLIWRHLATMPAILEWSWAVVKPLHQSGILAQHGPALRAGVQKPAGIRQPDCVFEALGIDQAARATIARMLDVYGVGNAANLLALSTVQALLEGGIAGGAVPRRACCAARGFTINAATSGIERVLAPTARAGAVARSVCPTGRG